MPAVVPAPTEHKVVASVRPLRLLPAPRTDPPYDDEPGARPVLRLANAPRSPASRARAVVRPTNDGPDRGRLVAVAVAAGTAPAVDHLAAGRRTLLLPTTGPYAALRSVPPSGRLPKLIDAAGNSLPAPRPFAHALVQRLLEICAGVRPLAQLKPDTTPALYDEIEQLLSARPKMTAIRPTRRDVRSVHVQERPNGVAEVCATVHRAGRAGALALRIEGERGRWLCTALLGL